MKYFGTVKIFKQSRGKIQGFVEFFSSQRTEKTSPGNHSVFQKISGREKNLWIRGGGYDDFPSKSFCLTVPKYFIGEHFGVSEKIFYRKISCIGAGAARFRRNFLSYKTETKSFLKEPFCFPEIFWYRTKFMDKRGHITIFSRNFCCLTEPKTFVRKSYCF